MLNSETQYIQRASRNYLHEENATLSNAAEGFVDFESVIESRTSTISSETQVERLRQREADVVA